MAELKARLETEVDRVMGDLLPRDHKFALLDFPDHDNIGDSAIYVGDVDYLAKHNLVPAFVSKKDNVDWATMERTIGGGPILLHGGGNVGDIWPDFQAERERVLNRYPNRRIIQMPQSLHFASGQAADRFARVIDRHGAFTLLVRDQPSFDFATRKFSCDVRLCPDIAFAMRSIHRRPPTYDVLLHLRDDKEAATTYDTAAYEASGRMVRTDWQREQAGSLYQQARRSAMRRGLLSLTFEKTKLRGMLLDKLARIRLDRGIDLLSMGRVVITDRLHGHILCCLLDIPHVALDNNYGKISNFSAAWGTAGPRARMASSLADAIAIVESGEL